jgi:hypothetical protein
MKYTNIYNLPQSLVDVIEKNTYDMSKSNVKRIGVTTLNGSPRIRMLTINHWKDLEEDISEHIWRIAGNACHYVLAKTEHDDRLIEEKLEEVVDDITIVGKPDLYDNFTKSIEDWKFTSVWSVKSENHDWEEQLNCYAWLLRKANFVVEKLFINALLKDWRKSELRRFGYDYPPIPFKRLEIKLWDFETQQKYIEERIKLHKAVIGCKDNDLPLCTPEERWKTEDTFAVYKNNNKTATRVLGSKEEAEKYILNIGVTKEKYTIQERLGSDIRCCDYCNVAPHCDYYIKKYGNKK